MKILVIDDEPDVSLLFQQKFKKEIREGHVEFTYAFSAEEALEHLEASEGKGYVLILSDINMPGMSGLELLKILKSKFPDAYVYMITAYNDPENYNRAMSIGANGYLTKPLDFNGLKNQLAELK